MFLVSLDALDVLLLVHAGTVAEPVRILASLTLAF